MATLLLTSKETFPSPEILKNALGKCYPAFDTLVANITNPQAGLALQWNYYADGKAWLCKGVYRKKTVCWLSVWDDGFKVTFYFLERHVEGLLALNIAEKIKTDFVMAKRVGKLMPLVLEICKKSPLADVLRLIEYKKGLK
jgi:hypothetical protein